MKETISCKICKKPTIYLGTQLCNNCWEVTHRLKRFLIADIAKSRLICSTDNLDEAIDIYNILKLKNENVEILGQIL